MSAPKTGDLWAQFFGQADYRLSWHAARIEVLPDGNLAYSTGPWEQVMMESGRLNHSTGTYFAVWRKQADGTWKVLIDRP